MKHAVLAIALIFVSSVSTRATEKHWIAHEAELIVIGTLHPALTYPWFDGWHINGTVEVEQVMFGPHVPTQIAYHFICSCCRHWPPPRLTRDLRAKGLWFLRPISGGVWRPTDGCASPGFRDLSERADWENYIRQVNH